METMETDMIKLDLVETSSPIQALLKTWKLTVEDLMAWLDWSYWRTCRPACSYEASAQEHLYASLISNIYGLEKPDPEFSERTAKPVLPSRESWPWRRCHS